MTRKKQTTERLFLVREGVGGRDREGSVKFTYYRACRQKPGQEYDSQLWPQTVVFQVEPYRENPLNYRPTQVDGSYPIILSIPFRTNLDQDFSPGFITDRILGLAADADSLDDRTLLLARELASGYAKKHDLEYIDLTTHNQQGGMVVGLIKD